MATSSAIILTKRSDIRDVIRQVLKSNGFKADTIHPVDDEKECLAQIAKAEFSILILDWEFGPDRVQKILASNRKQYRLESHPVFLIAAHEESAIIAVAHEYFVDCVAIGEVTTDTIREQIKNLVKSFNQVSPFRKVLLAVESCQQSGDTASAIDMLEKIYEKQKDNERLIISLAECYVQSDQWNKAEELLRTVLHIEEVSPRIKHLFARCRLRQGDYNTAVASLKGAQLLSPFNIERLLELGEIFLKIDRPEQAEAVFDDILEFAPSSKEAKFGKSTSKLLMGEVNEALQIINNAANPRELSAIFNMAAIMAIRQQRYDAAFALYQKALKLLAKNTKLTSRILYNMGIGYVKWSKPEKALRCFERSRDADPSFVDAAFNAGVIQKSTGAGSDTGLADHDSQGLDDKINTDMVDFEIGHDEEEVELDDDLNGIPRVG